jgi:signal transduction histidine kinase
LTEIDQLAGDALAETRQAIGVIRSADAGADLRPAPGIGDVEDLIARLRTPEVRVELHRDPSTSALPATLQTAAYRIVQESLNNVIKHASPATAQVTIKRHADALTVIILDDGNAAPNPARNGPGNGLRGMRERAEQAGGILEAGPDTRGGWRVRATFPLREADIV